VGIIGAASAPRSAGSSPRDANAAQVHAHFDSVLVELQSRAVAGLSSGGRARRAALIATVGDYNARGLFPNNDDFRELPAPYFVDRTTGVRCAVAHLLESTGRHDIVQRVARANNNGRAACR
jgi:hypothetical protein